MLFIKQIPNVDSSGITSMLKKLGVQKPLTLERGELKFYGVSSRRIKKIQEMLLENGYEMATGKREILSEKVKMVIEKMMEKESLPVINISAYISGEVGYNYTYISEVFSSVNGITIEHFVIRCRIGKAKKIMKENGCCIGDLAEKLHYKSVAHFSTQFKKVTGMTPSQYRQRLAGNFDKALQ